MKHRVWLVLLAMEIFLRRISSSYLPFIRAFAAGSEDLTRVVVVSSQDRIRNPIHVVLPYTIQSTAILAPQVCLM